MARDSDGIFAEKWADGGDTGEPVGFDRDEGWPIEFSQPGGSNPTRLLFNLLFKELSALAIELNQNGVGLEFSVAVDYTVKAIVRGSDGYYYIAGSANGPATAVKDPVGDTTGVWYQIIRTINGKNTYFVDYAEVDQGVTGNGRSIKAYVDIAGSDSATIVLRHNSGSATTTYTVATDETIPTNINLEIENGAILSIANSKTFTINSYFDAGLYQVFAGNGSVIFGNSSIKEVYPQWWGAVADGTNDDTTAVQAAYDSLTYGTLFFPVGRYSLSALTIHQNNRLRGDVVSQYGSTAGTIIESRSGGSLVSTNIAGAPTVLILAPDGAIESVAIENIKIKNTHYDWSLCFDGSANHLNVNHCKLVGGSGVGNKNGIYIHDGYWQYVDDTEFVHCEHGLHFGSGPAQNNMADITRSKFHFNDYGIYFEAGNGAYIVGCAFEANNNYDIYSLREHVVLDTCYFDAGNMLIYGIAEVGRPMHYPFISARDYNSGVTGLKTNGTYNIGIPHIDRVPQWKWGGNKDSYLTLTAEELTGTPTKVVTREGEGVNIATNNYVTNKKGKIIYSVPNTGDSGIVQSRTLTTMGMNMSSDWTIGLSFFNTNAVFPAAADIIVNDHFYGGNGFSIRVHGTGYGTPGLMDIVFYKGGASVVAQFSYKLFQGINMITISYKNSTDIGTIDLNGNTVDIAALSTKFAFQVGDTETIFKNNEAHGLYFIGFVACQGNYTNSELSLTHEDVPWKHESVNSLATQELLVHNKVRFPLPNTEALSANKTLTITDSPIQFLDPGAARDVILPAEEISAGLMFWIVNTANAAETITVKDDAAVTILTLGQNESGWVVCNGTTWAGFMGGKT